MKCRNKVLAASIELLSVVCFFMVCFIRCALLVSGVSSDVKAGESAGRQLKHVFAAIAFTELPLVSHSNVFNSVLKRVSPHY